MAKSDEYTAGAVGTARRKLDTGLGFFRDSWIELKKVHSPTWPELKQTTTLVVTMMVMAALFLGGVDFVVGLIMKKLLTGVW